jgi:hypothetical protein
MGELDRDALCETGTLLFGARWQSDLARALGTSTRMMRYWVAGTHPPPDDLNERLIRLIDARIAAMRDMTTRLDPSKEHRN